MRFVDKGSPSRASTSINSLLATAPVAILGDVGFHESKRSSDRCVGVGDPGYRGAMPNIGPFEVLVLLFMVGVVVAVVAAVVALTRR
jgi:hypothetical protein